MTHDDMLLTIKVVCPMHLPLSERGHERKALNVGAVLAEGDIPLLPKVSLSLSLPARLLAFSLGQTN